ncbi:60S ribosomal protein L23a-like [Marmota marmota marmota]|uniref:60S ribosomal protein L23a-like n=1 Tax=Marmota marmota marmota TaxID=9994 RepID=UPI0007626341|nr:60S ribosomal protein L23a-like [Marmota marmota marmota]
MSPLIDNNDMKEASAPSKDKDKDKSRVLKAKKAVKTCPRSPHTQVSCLLVAQDTISSRGSPEVLPRAPLGETIQLHYYAIPNFSLTTESAKKTTENNTLVLTVDVKSNKHQKFYVTDVAKVNTLMA